MYPIQVRITWDLNPPSDQVTGYKLSVDGGAAIAVPPSGGPVSANVTITAPGPHVFAVVASNLLGDGPAAQKTVTFPAAAPAAVVNLTVSLS